MQNLIVLGLVPGTGIQITFLAWLVFVIATALLGVVWLVRRARLIRNWLIATSLFIVTHRRFQS